MSTKNVKDTNVKATETQGTPIKKTIPMYREAFQNVLPKVIELDTALAADIDKALAKKNTTMKVFDALAERLNEVLSKVDLTKKVVVTVENEKKPAPKKKVVTKKPVEEPKAEETVGGITKIKKTDNKDTKSETPKKEAPKKSEPKVKSIPQTKASLPVAKMFPKEITVEGIGKLTVAPDKFKTVKDIADAMEKGTETFYFATYWTARQIKEFSYSVVNRVAPIKEFPDDLDILDPVYYAERNERLWCNSVYTEAMFEFDKESLEHIKDKDPYTGEDYRVRVSNGMEFELYVLAEESETK